MPTLDKYLRQRERTNARTWKPLAPNFIVYAIFSAVYSRTYSLVDLEYNRPLQHNDPIPFGFKFIPTPDPPLVPLLSDSGINAIVPIGETSTNLVQIPNIPQVPSSPPLVPTPPSPLTTPQQLNSLIQPGFFTIKMGIVSKPLNVSPLIVRTVTILADINNTGVVWINTVNSSGVNTTFPLVAGAGIVLGDLNSNKGLDISQIFVIGTNAADVVRVATQQ